MKKTWIILLIVAVALALAMPAAGKGKPNIAVDLDAAPIWVHEADDEISYEVSVQNKTRQAVTVDVWFDEVLAKENLEVPARQTENVSLGSKRVGDFPEFTACGESCMLTESVTVAYAGGEVVAETSTDLMPYDRCVLPGPLDGAACIWTPDSTGQWTVTVQPGSKPHNTLVTVRDHVPGNWCVLPDGSGGVFSDRWRPSDGPIELPVYLPADGKCLGNGAGGESIEPVGNPTSFYLVAKGMVTVTQP